MGGGDDNYCLRPPSHGGLLLLASYNNWPEVICNLHRAQQKWAYLSQVLGQDGEDACMSGIFYTALVQVVLLYSS